MSNSNMSKAGKSGRKKDETSADEARGRDFFQLEPDEVSSWKVPTPAQVVKKKRDWKLVIWVAAVALAVALIIVIAVLLIPTSKVKTPSIEGKMLGEALEIARTAGLRPTVSKWEYSDRHSDGIVLSQTPRAGSTAKRGSELSLTVSKGSEKSANLTPGNTSQTQGGPRAEKVVCIDPGHQAIMGQGDWVDPGMNKRSPALTPVRGVASGTPEYLLTMDIGEKLKTLLEKDGIKVVMTRQSGGIDMNEATRAEMANNADALLLVSIHMNSSDDPFARGTSTAYPARTKWTDAIYEKSKAAAIFIQKDLVKSCGTSDLGISPRDDLAVLNWSRVPAVETFIAYLTNPEDDSLLSEDGFRAKAAWGLRNGIISYFNNP